MKTPPCSGSDVKHRQQTGMRTLKMPVLFGALFCAAGRFVIPKKAFSQGEGMSRPVGIMCLRPLLGSLSAIVAAILLSGSSRHSDPQAPPGIGIMYLENSDAVGDPIHNWATDPALTNQFVQGIALRTQWGRVEPHEHANADDFYWDFLDQGVALAAAHGKKVSILVTAGVTTPQWVYDAGAPLFNGNGAIWLFVDHRWSYYCRVNYGDKCRGHR